MKLCDFLKLSKDDIKGKIICFPTDTVYGVGCRIDDEEAVKKIYELKKRDLNKPLAILINKESAMKPYVANYPLYVSKWIKEYWPGALTIVLNASKKGDLLCNAHLETIGFRVPDSPIALAICEKFGPMATTSVNISQEKPLNSEEEILKVFPNEIDYIISDKVNLSKISSTVVDVTKNPYQVIRQGSIKL